MLPNKTNFQNLKNSHPTPFPSPSLYLLSHMYKSMRLVFAGSVSLDLTIGAKACQYIAKCENILQMKVIALMKDDCTQPNYTVKVSV